jgi:hypothetical protein
VGQRFELSGSVTIAATEGIVSFQNPGDGEWYIERMAFVRDGAGAGEIVAVYVGAVDNAGLRDATAAPATFPAIADENMPVRVPPFSSFFGRVTGGTNGDIWTITASMDDRTNYFADEEALADSGLGHPDSLLIEPGFPNQKRIPSGRR